MQIESVKRLVVQLAELACHTDLWQECQSHLARKKKRVQQRPVYEGIYGGIVCIGSAQQLLKKTYH